MPKKRSTVKKGLRRRRGGSFVEWAKKAMDLAKKYKVVSKASTYIYGKYGKSMLNKSLAKYPNVRIAADYGVEAGLARLRQSGYGTRRTGMGTRRTGNGTRRTGGSNSDRMKY